MILMLSEAPPFYIILSRRRENCFERHLCIHILCEIVWSLESLKTHTILVLSPAHPLLLSRAQASCPLSQVRPSSSSLP